MAEQKGAMPNAVVSTEGLPREEWLAYRRKGIGGSDAAAVLGISPFRTGVDLYYDKLGQPVEDDEQNWVSWPTWAGAGALPVRTRAAAIPSP